MTVRRLDPFVRDQFPSYVRTSGNDLVEFVRAYYKWLDHDDRDDRDDHESVDSDIQANQNVDRSVNFFFERLRDEVASGLPVDTAANNRFLTKHVNDLYDSFGTSDGLETMFRAFYDESVGVARPGELVLRPSDGRWRRDNFILIQGHDNDFVEGERVRGDLSGVTAWVEEVRKERNHGDVKVTVLILSNVRRGSNSNTEFVIGETIRSITANSEHTGSLFEGSGPIDRVEITLDGGGYGHEVTDQVTIGNLGAEGEVINVELSGSIEFEITNGGDGYRYDADAEANSDYSDIISVEVIHSEGVDANFIVTSIANTEIIDIITRDISDELDDLISMHLNDEIKSLDNTITKQVGRIANISMDTVSGYVAGTGYTSVPRVVVRDRLVGNYYGEGGLGYNAIVTPSRIDGAIVSVTVTDGGQGYDDGAEVTVHNTSDTSASDATATVSVSGFSRDAGRYEDEGGWPSSDVRIHDGDYYQDRSYVVCSSRDRATYLDDVMKLFHPAGTKMFSETETLQEF